MKRMTPGHITLSGWRGTLIIAAVLFFAAIGVVFAYNTLTTTYPNPSTASPPPAGKDYKTASQAASFGHTADELNVYLGAGGTEPCIGTKTLQDAIASKCLGGTTSADPSAVSGLTFCELTVKELRDYGCPYGSYLAKIKYFHLTEAGGPRDAYCKIFSSTNDNSADTAANPIKSCYGAVYRASVSDVNAGTCATVGNNVACSELNDCCPHSGGAYFCEGNPLVWKQKINVQCW